MMGAGEGMAKGGGEAAAATRCSAAPGWASAWAWRRCSTSRTSRQQQQPAAQQPAAPAGGVGQVTCGKCGAKTAPGKFCAECGQPLAEKKAFCSECGKPMNPGAKFCGECGAKQGG